MTVFQLGDRVRTTVDAPSAFENPRDVYEAFSAPAGTPGTITSLPREYGGYGVLLDGDPNQLPADYAANELAPLN